MPRMSRLRWSGAVTSSWVAVGQVQSLQRGGWKGVGFKGVQGFKGVRGLGFEGIKGFRVAGISGFLGRSIYSPLTNTLWPSNLGF